MSETQLTLGGDTAIPLPRPRTPLYCVACEREREVDRRMAENHTITEYDQ